MKFAVAALVATASALDFIGCQGADWGNSQEMHTESDCIFHKLAGPGQKELHGKVLVDLLEKYCHWRNPNIRLSQCDTMAQAKEKFLIGTFGHDGEINQAQFYRAYYAVKEHQHEEDTMGFASVFHAVNGNGECVQLDGT